MSNLPLHIAVLDRLAENVELRIDTHQVKAGLGLEDRDYQRHVGRIAEGKALRADIEALRKQLLQDDDIEDPQTEKPRESRRRRSK